MKNNELKEVSDIELEDIISQYSSYLYTTVKSISNGYIIDQDIEEIVADTFIVLWKNKEKYDKKRELKFYLSGVAKNIIKQKFRTMQYEYCLEEYENSLIDNLSINDICENNEKEKIIQNELSKLYSQDRKIFIDFYYGSKKIKNISKDLGISEILVKSKLHRIRKKLKKGLERNGYSYGK